MIIFLMLKYLSCFGLKLLFFYAEARNIIVTKLLSDKCRAPENQNPFFKKDVWQILKVTMRCSLLVISCNTFFVTFFSSVAQCSEQFVRCILNNAWYGATSLSLGIGYLMTLLEWTVIAVTGQRAVIAVAIISMKIWLVLRLRS